jgi:predicted DNA-binding transcriptional regulator AlpA
MSSSGTRASKRRKSKSKRKQSPQKNWCAAGLPPPAGHNAPPNPPVEHRDRVLTFPQWCAINGFSKATGWRLIRNGDGPPVLQLSPRRVGVKESANAEWQASRTR